MRPGPLLFLVLLFTPIYPIEEKKMSSETKKNYLPLIMLILIFGIPFLASTIFILNPGLLAKLSTAGNHGELIQPVRALPTELKFSQINGDEFRISKNLDEKWTLLLVTNSICDKICEKNIFHLRQIRLAMADDRDFVNRLVVLNETSDLEKFKEKIVKYTKMYVVTENKQSIEKLLSAVDPINKDRTNHIYIIDPFYNVMMHYKPTDKAEGIINDLSRLLKATKG